MAEASDRIIAKIQKLLELGARSKGNEEEAALAMAKAQELLAQYNLDMAVVREAQVAGGVQPDKPKREERKINKSAQYDWQKELWKTLADCNFCWHFVQTFDEKVGKTRDGRQKYTRVKRHVVLGAVENVTMVNMMGEYLCDTIERLLPWTDNKVRLSREAISWRAGCATRLRKRLLDQLWERRKNMHANKPDGTSSETGLMLCNVETAEYIANYDFMFGDGAYARMLERQRKADELAKTQPNPIPEETEAERIKRHKREQRERERLSNKYDAYAFSEGYAKGADINLNNQVGAGKPGNRLPD